MATSESTHPLTTPPTSQQQPPLSPSTPPSLLPLSMPSSPISIGTSISRTSPLPINRNLSTSPLQSSSHPPLHNHQPLLTQADTDILSSLKMESTNSAPDSRQWKAVVNKSDLTIKLQSRRKGAQAQPEDDINPSVKAEDDDLSSVSSALSAHSTRSRTRGSSAAALPSEEQPTKKPRPHSRSSSPMHDSPHSSPSHCSSSPPSSSPDAASSSRRLPWTPSELSALISGVSQHGKDWAAIMADPKYGKILRRRTLVACRKQFMFGRAMGQWREGRLTVPSIDEAIQEEVKAVTHSHRPTIKRERREEVSDLWESSESEPESEAEGVADIEDDELPVGKLKSEYRRCRHQCGCRGRGGEMHSAVVNKHGRRNHEKSKQSHPSCRPGRSCYKLLFNLRGRREGEREKEEEEEEEEDGEEEEEEREAEKEALDGERAYSAVSSPAMYQGVSLPNPSALTSTRRISSFSPLPHRPPILSAAHSLLGLGPNLSATSEKEDVRGRAEVAAMNATIAWLHRERCDKEEQWQAREEQWRAEREQLQLTIEGLQRERHAERESENEPGMPPSPLVIPTPVFGRPFASPSTSSSLPFTSHPHSAFSPPTAAERGTAASSPPTPLSAPVPPPTFHPPAYSPPFAMPAGFVFPYGQSFGSPMTQLRVAGMGMYGAQMATAVQRGSVMTGGGMGQEQEHRMGQNGKKRRGSDQKER